MKPVGRERDIEIARLKGYVKQIVSNGTTYEKDNTFMAWVKDCNWSTDRNDTWELWDELPLPKGYTEREGYIFLSVGYANDLTMIDVKGKSFADCVSQAWIKFKEDK